MFDMTKVRDSFNEDFLTYGTRLSVAGDFCLGTVSDEGETPMFVRAKTNGEVTVTRGLDKLQTIVVGDEYAMADRIDGFLTAMARYVPENMSY